MWKLFPVLLCGCYQKIIYLQRTCCDSNYADRDGRSKHRNRNIEKSVDRICAVYFCSFIKFCWYGLKSCKIDQHPISYPLPVICNEKPSKNRIRASKQHEIKIGSQPVIDSRKHVGEHFQPYKTYNYRTDQTWNKNAARYTFCARIPLSSATAKEVPECSGSQYFQ